MYYNFVSIKKTEGMKSLQLCDRQNKKKRKLLSNFFISVFNVLSEMMILNQNGHVRFSFSIAQVNKTETLSSRTHKE